MRKQLPPRVTSYSFGWWIVAFKSTIFTIPSDKYPPLATNYSITNDIKIVCPSYRTIMLCMTESARAHPLPARLAGWAFPTTIITPRIMKLVVSAFTDVQVDNVSYTVIYSAPTFDSGPPTKTYSPCVNVCIPMPSYPGLPAASAYLETS